MTTSQPVRNPVPRKLNQGMIDALSLAISKGNYAVTACQLCGVDEDTLRRWLDLGKQHSLLEVESEYSALYAALKRAEAEAEIALVDVVRESATVKREWLPAMTFLERRHPDRWGRRERHDVNIEQKVVNITRVTVVRPQGDTGQIVEGEVKELTEGEQDATK